MAGGSVVGGVRASLRPFPAGSPGLRSCRFRVGVCVNAGDGTAVTPPSDSRSECVPAVAYAQAGIRGLRGVAADLVDVTPRYPFDVSTTIILVPAVVFTRPGVHL